MKKKLRKLANTDQTDVYYGFMIVDNYLFLKCMNKIMYIKIFDFGEFCLKPEHKATKMNMSLGPNAIIKRILSCYFSMHHD